MHRISKILTLVSLVSAVALVHASGAAAGDFADEPCIASGSTYLCPTATAGSAYSIDIKLKEPWPNCTEFRVTSGSFPQGLSINDDGNVRGTPTTAGSYTFYLTVFWKQGGDAGCITQNPSDRQFTINVNPQVLRAFVSTNSLPDANIGQAYTAPALTAQNATSISSWSLTGGTLPPGMTLNPNGVISGTPTASGQFNFTVQANASPNSDTKSLSIFVMAPLELQALDGKKAPTTGFAAKSLLNATLTTGVKAVGGRGGYTFASAGALPPGITLDPSTGAITGAGTRAGTFSPTITVTDQTGAKLSLPFRITILPLLDFVAGKKLPAGRVDRFYAAKLPIKGKDSTTALFALAGKIPPGLEYNDLTRRLEGTLLKAGTYRLRVYAFSANGAPISKLFTIKVRP
jgi:large repetitive protein